MRPRHAGPGVDTPTSTSRTPTFQLLGGKRSFSTSTTRSMAQTWPTRRQEQSCARAYAPRGSSEAWLRASRPEYAQQDVDMELWGVLSMASEEELVELYNILYGPSPLSPVFKSLSRHDDPSPMIHHTGREEFMRRLESRFRFLAADSLLLARGMRPAYRDTLIAVRRRLGVRCPEDLLTQDLEVEIFLHLLEASLLKATRAASSFGNIPPTASETLAQEGDGMTVPLSAAARWREVVSTPLRVGATDLVDSLGKIGGAIFANTVRNSAVETALKAFAKNSINYEGVIGTVCRKGVASAAQEAAAAAARKGMTTAAARYGAIRALSSMLTPALMAWVAADLLLKATGTDYGRVVRAIFALAQIRLVRTYGFTQGRPDQIEEAREGF